MTYRRRPSAAGTRSAAAVLLAALMAGWPVLQAGARNIAIPPQAGRAPLAPPCACGTTKQAEQNARAMADHERRRLDEASAGYAQVLDASPPGEPTATQWRLIQKFAPRLFVTHIEPFPLKDFAAVMHPAQPWVSYHLFWEDDIDFPDDNDPCDHELLWVRFDPATERVAAYYTYFHGRLLRAPPDAVAEANRSGGRPRVLIQWGKHGTLPPGWERLEIVADSGDAERDFYPLGQAIPLETYMRGTFRKLAEAGRRGAGSPLGAGWPKKFSGPWEAFVSFTREVDPLPMLKSRRMVRVSCWNNATINRYFLRYNFRVKTEWPPEICP